jgi:DNA polymerase V
MVTIVKVAESELPPFVPWAEVEAVLMQCPLFLASVPAGFPSPAEEYIERKLDLNEYIVRNPIATFFLHVRGMSMEGARIFNGDMVCVDRSIDPASGLIVLAAVDNEFTIKRIKIYRDIYELHSENVEYPPIVFQGDQELRIAGVITACIRKFKV